MRLQGRKIYPGVARGEALVCAQGISFFGGVDPETGIVVERGHELEGRSIAGKVLVFPAGKGSTVGSYTLYRLKANGLAPLAIVNRECETITAVGCIIAEIPCVDQVDQVDLERLRNGQMLQVDGEAGTVEILGPASLPPPLRGSEPGSFTEDTMSRRLPDIARRLVDEGEWSPQVRLALGALADDMPQGRLRPLQDAEAFDHELWDAWLEPFIGQTWLEAPWFPAETYFFRRVLEATGYFRPGPEQGRDPYLPQKRESLVGLSQQVERVRASLERAPAEPPGSLLAKLLQTLIWGNQADLSIWPAGSEPPESHAGDQRSAHLLVDDSGQAAQYVLAQPNGLARVAIILDNVGLELAYDLLLADFLLESGLARQIILHAKLYPTYVSDATIPDIRLMIDHLAGTDSEITSALGKRLRSHLETGRLNLSANSYWISPLPAWEMPPDLRQELGSADLLVSKGDANYRRWLGDRHWETTRPVQEITAYRPAPLLLIRVLKSELIVGLRPGQAEEMDQKDPQWLYNGSWGVIQFIP